MAALLDFLSIPVLAVGVIAVARMLPPAVGAILAIAAAVIIGRQLRALENLGHEASHFNWSRHHRIRNDVAAVAFVSFPAGVRLRDYRESHLLHHGRFGTADDPDRMRYEALGLEELDRTSRLRFARDLARRLCRYELGWLAAMKAGPAAFALPFAWAALFVATPAMLLFGPADGALALPVWLAGYLVALPVIRLIAESSEHVYTGNATVFEATITNLGTLQRALFHPHNDGYHTVHHMWPGIPHHQLRRVHLMLLREDPAGYGQRLRYRRRLVQPPACRG